MKLLNERQIPCQKTFRSIYKQPTSKNQQFHKMLKSKEKLKIQGSLKVPLKEPPALG